MDAKSILMLMVRKRKKTINQKYQKCNKMQKLVIITPIQLKRRQMTLK